VHRQHGIQAGTKTTTTPAKMNIQAEIKSAIDRSISHTEIVKVEAANKEGYEVWAGPEGTEKMEWRLRIVVAN
jgi:hypothetical protein